MTIPLLITATPLPFMVGNSFDTKLALTHKHSTNKKDDPSPPHKQPSHRLLFAAGGTGGHVYPAIAIADALQHLQPSIQIEFAGTKHRLEWSVLPDSGYTIHPFPAFPIRRPIFSPSNLLFPFRLIYSVWICLGLLRAFRPQLVLGTGGYVSAPLCIAALLLGCPLAIQEQNAYPGIANRVLGLFATKIFVAFSAAVAFFPEHKCVLCGNPIRSSLCRYVSKAVAFRHFFPTFVSFHNAMPPSANAPAVSDQAASMHSRSGTSVVILVLGGSLGAKSINTAIRGMVLKMLDTFSNRYFIWQTGSEQYGEIAKLFGNHPRLFISKFLNHMELSYAAADLVIARSGAITCSELLITGKPSILIPSSKVAEDHQSKNAMLMVEAGAAKVLSNNDLGSTSLEATINEVLWNDCLMTSMREKALKAANPDAAFHIAKELISLAETSASPKPHVGTFKSVKTD